MNLIFFGDEELFSNLESEISFTPKLITTDEEQCSDWLENNAGDKKVYLFIDYDLGKKQVDKFLLSLRNDFPKLVAVLVYENLKVKELKKHQSGKYAADGYLKKPINKENVEAVLEDFELGEFITKKNLLEEGTQIPPIPSLGSLGSDDDDELESDGSGLMTMKITSEERELSGSHQSEASEFDDEVNSGIQAVFDGTSSDSAQESSGLSLGGSSDGLDLSLDDDEEFEEDELTMASDESSPDLGGLDLEQEEEISQESNLAFEFSGDDEIAEPSLNTDIDLDGLGNEEEEEAPTGDISLGGISLDEDFDGEEPLENDESEVEESGDSTLMIKSDDLLALKEDNDSDDLDIDEDELSLGEEDMGQDNDDLLDDDLTLDAGLDDDMELEKTVVEKYDMADEGGALPELDELEDFDDSLESEIDDELDEDFVEDFSSSQNAMSLDDSLEDGDDELDDDLSMSMDSGIDDSSNEHILPNDEDLEFPTMSEIDANSAADEGALATGELDLDAVDQTLSQIVQTDEITMSELKKENAADDFSIGEDDFALDDTDDQLMDINKINLSDDSSNSDEIVDELDFDGGTDITEFGKKLDEDGPTLQFDSSTEKTSEQINIADESSPEVNITEVNEEETVVLSAVTVESELNSEPEATETISNLTQDASDDGLVFANIDQTSSSEPVHERPLGVSEMMTEGEKNLISGHHENELLRLQTIIRQLREEREELLENIHVMESDKKVLERENLGLRAEVDELKIELGIIRKRHREELEELKYRNRISEEKKLLAQEKSKKLDRELSRLQQRIHIDLNKVRQREKELESKLELAKIDSDSQVKARDQKIIELKRKIDQLEFNMENVAMKEQQSRTEKIRTEERLNRIMKTLRGSIELLEDDIQYDSGSED